MLDLLKDGPNTRLSKQECQALNQTIQHKDDVGRKEKQEIEAPKTLKHPCQQYFFFVLPVNPDKYSRKSKQDDQNQPQEGLFPDSDDQKMDRQHQQKGAEINCQIDRTPMVACDLLTDDEHSEVANHWNCNQCGNKCGEESRHHAPSLSCSFPLMQ